ncbi:MAG: N-acetylmuramoyl-L-alanine amidase [Rhodothermales bacterium]|nr:N-acetylmuramoyl-L-alanine amidase [Rhodothermales bacterium]
MADTLIGTFEGLSSLRTDETTMLLTTVSADTDAPPSSAPLPAARERSGQLAVVRGERRGDVLFEARVVEVLSQLASEVTKSLLDDGVLTLADLVERTLAAEQVFTGGPAPAVPGGQDAPQDDVPAVTCALVVGHCESAKGASSSDGLAEFEYNDGLAPRIRDRVRKAKVEIVHRDEPNQRLQLPAKVNALRPDFIISLHCNAFNGSATGTETLYFHTSNTGHRYAKIVQRHVREALGLRDRHTKAKTAGDRGGHLLKNTAAPCVIAEPFFIDNDADVATARANEDALISAYAAAIDEIAEHIAG